MNNEHQKYWDAKHLEEEELAKISGPSVFVEEFETVLLDNKGSDPRRSHKDGLVRFIGRKP